MKVTKAGMFIWHPVDGVVTSGWEMDAEGEDIPTEREVLAIMLNHIAAVNGIATKDAMRAANTAIDVIERARKAGM